VKLFRPPYPDLVDTAGYFWIQAGHRRTAIDLALGAIADLPAETGDPLMAELDPVMHAWASETLIQGACLREYHHWEADTKRYFSAVYPRNGLPAPNWKSMVGSHVEKVTGQLAAFGLAPAPSMPVLDRLRSGLNELKHEDAYLVSMADYDELCQAITDFWDHVEASEVFVMGKS
jgi:hypothetical protein